MNITEYFKRLFGEERNKDVPELQGLEEFINDLIQTKKPQPQELPEYQRKNPVVKTDEEIRKEAQDSLGEYLENSRKNIENDYEQDLSDKLRKKDNYNSQKQSQLDALDSAYSRAFENSNNDSIRRGVARSSIAEEKTKQLGKQKDSEITQLNDEYALKLQEIDSQIETLNAKKQKAINDLEIRYASKLNDKIEELTTQRQKTIEDALEYNNKLEKQEYEDKLNAQKAQNEDFTPDNDFYRQVFLKADELLGNLTASQARKAVLENAYLKEYLNDYYYYKLYKKYV